MKTREQITVTGDFPARDHDDAVATLIGRADDEAQRKGLSLFGGRETMNVTTIWLRSHGTPDHPACGECMPDQADTARVTLSAWAEPQ